MSPGLEPHSKDTIRRRACALGLQLSLLGGPSARRVELHVHRSLLLCGVLLFEAQPRALLDGVVVHGLQLVAGLEAAEDDLRHIVADLLGASDKLRERRQLVEPEATSNAQRSSGHATAAATEARR